MNVEGDSYDEVRAEAVLSGLMSLRDSLCCDCKAPICAHEALMSLAMGFKNTPMCLGCLAAVLERGREELRDHIFAYIEHRSCHYAGWLWANREEGFEPAAFPGCLWPSPSASCGPQERNSPPPAFTDRAGRSPGLKYDAEWDAGDMGCGDLVLQLRFNLRALQPGQVLKVTAMDPGAREDLPAWCRLTGHELMASNHPEYLIKRKEK